MKTLPFFVLALTCLSALAETAVPPIPLATQEGVVPAATPEASASPSASPAVVAPSPSPVSVQAPTPAPSAAESSKFDPTLLGGTNPVLTEEERAGVNITRAWKERSYSTMVGQAGANSSVQFRYGESLPSIVCAILQVTDIELQAGEVITHINVGDTTRWTVESALSGGSSSSGGSGSDQVEHLIVKPRDIGLSTSLVVTTDRRTYHLLLVSDEADFMHYVTFLYGAAPSPATAPAVVSATPAPSPVDSESDAPAPHHGDGKQVRLISREEPDDADESYTVTGHADWKPVQVYTKGGKTYLEMPSSVRHKEAPVLFEEKRVSWFHHEKVLVNYRVHGKWYVVDRVLDSAALISGVGGGQEKVTIRHVDNAKAKSTEGVPR
jgi:type IV secretion system protein TrbG